MAESLIIELDLQLPDGQVGKATGKINRAFKEEGKRSGQTFSEGFRNSFAGNIAAIGFAKLLGGIRNEVRETARAAQQLEVFETQFKTILGSTAAAQRQLADLQKFAATTPFQLSGLSVATRQLLSFGVAQNEIIPTLGQLGDIAAGVGAEITDLAIPFGRLISTQKLTLVELDKFADRGVNLYKSLADGAGVSIKDIRDEISKGRVDFDLFTSALDDLTSEGGTFFQGAIAQSKTLAGTISTLEDNIFNLRGAIGETFRDSLIQGTQLAIIKVQELTQFISDNRTNIVLSFVDIGKSINDFVIAPLTLLGNIADVIFNSLKTGLQAILVAVSAIGTGTASVLNAVGVLSDETLEKLKTFTQSSTDVFNSFASDTNQSLDGIFANTIYGDADQFLENLRANVTSANEITSELSGAGLTPQGDEAQQSAQDQFSGFLDGFRASQDKFVKATKEKTKDLGRAWAAFGQSAKKSIGQGLGQGFAAFGAAIASGENALDAFVKSFLGAIGQMAIQQGTAFILQGLGFNVIPGLQASGSVLVAQGAALATFGGALTALAGGGGSSPSVGTSSSTGGGSPIESGFEDEEEDDFESQFQQSSTSTVIIQGDILGDEASGARIVELVNAANESTDVRINSEAIA